VADNLTRAGRSYCMSRVKSRDTAPEQQLRSTLHRAGLRFRKHVRSLPGSPDLVVTRAHVAVFIDGDFWHGYRFPAWEHTLPDFWKRKIGINRARDRRNFRRLRSMGWIVIRVWQHQIERDVEACARKVLAATASTWD
jgi:DNA mismatch endonuclease (patch repair protein)